MIEVNNWLKNIQLRFWPQCCQLCGDGPLQADSTLCLPCLMDLPWNLACCSICALPLPQNAICGQCLRKPPPYHRTLATFRYQDPLSHIVHSLKYGQRLHYGRFLGGALADMIVQDIGDNQALMPDLILPVPLHQQRLNERGYNQALEIAKPIAKALNCALSDRMLIRRIATREQSSLSARERRKNLKGVFALRYPDRASFKGTHIAIVDDVMTTGATVNELARVLVKAGARRIDVWVAARAALGGKSSPKT